MDYPLNIIYMYIYLHISVHMYPFGFIHMLPPHILVSCQVGQYLPKAMLAQNWIPQHWIQLHCFCNLVCHKPQKSLMLSAVLDPWAQSGNSFGVWRSSSSGFNPKNISDQPPTMGRIMTDHDESLESPMKFVKFASVAPVAPSSLQKGSAVPRIWRF